MGRHRLNEVARRAVGVEDVSEATRSELYTAVSMRIARSVQDTDNRLLALLTVLL